MLSAPRRMAPLASRRSISVASRPAGAASRLIFEPASVGSPAISNRFLTANGTPASGGSFSPRARASSSACARRCARSSVTAVKELIRGSRARIRAKAASTTLWALTRPAANAAATSPAFIQAESNAVVSSTEHRRRLDVVGERKFIDPRRMFEQQLQIECHTRVPRRLDWQRQQLARRGSDDPEGVGSFGAKRARRLARPSHRFCAAAWGFAGHATDSKR